jgi:hypothetical protein
VKRKKGKRKDDYFIAARRGLRAEEAVEMLTRGLPDVVKSGDGGTTSLSDVSSDAASTFESFLATRPLAAADEGARFSFVTRVVRVSGFVTSPVNVDSSPSPSPSEPTEIFGRRGFVERLAEAAAASASDMRVDSSESDIRFLRHSKNRDPISS